MNCSMAEERFSAYLEDELDYQTIKEFESHLSTCNSCKTEFAVFRKSVNLLHQMPRIEPSFEFDRNLQSKIADFEVDKVPTWRQILGSLRARRVWAFGGIAAILLIVLVGAYFYPSGLDRYESTVPKIVIETDSDTGYRRVKKIDNREVLAIPVRQVNVPLDIGNGSFIGGGARQRMPQRAQQHFILQTVNYSSTPSGGGL